MKILRHFLLATGLTAAAAAVPAQIDAYHDVDSATHQAKINALGNAGYRPITISAYGTANNLRYAAVWVHRPGVNFIPFHGLTSAGYQNLLVSNPGYIPTIVSVADGGGNARFAGVLELTGNPIYARHDQTLQDFATELQTARSNGWRIKTADRYGTAQNARFIVSFEPNPNNIGWGAYTANDEFEHDARFDGLSVAYARQTIGAFDDFNRFLSCWDDTIVGQTIVHHDLTSAQYDQLANQYWNQNGFIPINICASGSGNGARFAAVWAATDLPMNRQWSTSGQFVPDLQTFDAWVQNFMQINAVRGAALAVVKDGELKLARGYTWAEPGYPQTQPTDVFRTASLAKPITSIAVHQQIELTPGSFNYQTTMSSMFGNPQLALNADLIDIQDLLTHEGGWDSSLQGNFDPMFIDQTIVQNGNGLTYPISTNDIRLFMNPQPLDFTPGNQAAYSNYGFMLLARMLEQQNPGKSFVELVKDRIFDPLGLTRPKLGRAHFDQRLPNEVLYHPRVLTSNRSVNDNNRPWVAGHYGGWNQENMDGNGAWVMAAPDLAKILASFDFGLFNPILGPTETGNMWTLDAGASFLKGWWRNNQGTTVPLAEHNGILPGTRTYMGRRQDGISFVFLTNGDKTIGSVEGAQLSTLADNVSIWPGHDLFPSTGIVRFKQIGDLKTPFGSPCPGSTTTPFLTATGSAMIGDRPSMDLFGALPNTGVLSMVGTTQTSVDLAPLGAPGCTLLVDPIVMDLIFSNSAGMAATLIDIPTNASLVGQHLFVQDAIYDPSANALDFVTSNGIDIEIGGWIGY